MTSRAGSNAGRGFHYQDAVAAWLTASSWAGHLDWGLIIPEGEDDIELRGPAGRAFAQAKSRRDHLGPYSPSEVAGFARELWDRHDAAGADAPNLMLILERPVARGSTAPGDGTALPIEGHLAALLQRDPRAATHIAKTQILILGAPQELSIQTIVQKSNCSPLAAQICYSELLGRLAALADANGRLGPADYLGLSLADADLAIHTMLGTVDLETLEGAIARGICEPVDFLTPLHDPTFYLGVDVEPGHVAAGLVAERPSAREATAAALESRRNALIVGPSGAGKSALMWEVAHWVRHSVRWYRIRRFEPADMPALRRLAIAFRASDTSPLGFVFDDVGRHGAEGWSELSREASSIPGLILLGSIREEDIFLLAERSRSVEIRAEASDELPQRLWAELREAGLTTWPGWREPWEASRHLVLEYVHMLTSGERLAAVLKDQVAARQRDPTRTLELDILRISSTAGAAGSAVDVRRMGRILDCQDAEISRSLHRLIDEHLVRENAAGLLGGLHQLRSEALARLCHEVPPPTYEETLAQTLRCVPTAYLEALVADALVREKVALCPLIASLASRLEEEPDPASLASILRGLGSGHIAASVEKWLELPQVEALPRTQIGSAAMFGIAGLDLESLDFLPGIREAADALAAIKASPQGDPRHLLIERLRPGSLADLIERTAGLNDLEQILAALVGQPLPSEVASVLRTMQADLLNAELNLVARLLGSLTLLDPDLALAWSQRAGQQALLDRVTAEIAWAGPVALREEADGLMACCDYWYVAASQQPNPHDDVVRICELILSLAPAADYAVSRAINADGTIVGTGELDLVSKRIPRANLPPASLPEWNRRWRDAIAFRVAAPSYSDYLSRAIALLDALVPALDEAFDTLLRGKDLPPRLVDRLNGLNADAEKLTPPRQSAADASGSGTSEPNRAVTRFQDVLHGATVNLIKRFVSLPEGAPAYAQWLSDLIKQIDAAAEEEPWSIIGCGLPVALERLRELLSFARLLASEAQHRSEHPLLTWHSVGKGARRGNAVRAVRAMATPGAARRRREFLAQLEDSVRHTGIDVLLHAHDDPDGPSWPALQVLALVRSENVESAMNGVGGDAVALRQVVDANCRLVVMPYVSGVAIDRIAFTGYDQLFPIAGSGAEWLDQLGIPRLATNLTSAFDQAVAHGSELAAMDARSLAREGRAAEELSARGKLDAAFKEASDILAVRLAGEPRLLEQVKSVVSHIREGRFNAAGEAQAYFHGEPSEGLDELGRLTFRLIQRDLEAQLDELAPRPSSQLH